MKAIGLNETDYQQKISTNNLSYPEMLRLADFFQVNLDNMVEDRLDFTKIRKSFITPSQCISDDYLLGAGTYMESIRVIYNYVKDNFNLKTADNMLASVNIHKNVLLNDSIMVNSDLINDLLDHIFTFLNMDEQHLMLMAISGYSSNRRKQLLELGKSKTTDYGIAKTIVDNSKQYEMNFSYEIEKLNEEYFKIKTISKEASNDRMSKAEIASNYTVMYKEAIIKILYSLIGKNQPNILNIENSSKNGRQIVNYIFKETKLSSNFNSH